MIRGFKVQFRSAWDCDAPNGDNAMRASFNTAIGSIVNGTRYTMMHVSCPMLRPFW